MNKPQDYAKIQEEYEKVNQRKVQTPYGKGLVLRKRTAKNDKGTEKEDNVTIYEIQLSTWKLSNNTCPTLYTCANPPSIRPKINDDVICTYGRGIVISSYSVNDDATNMYHIELTSWKLNGRSKVHIYINESSLSVVRPKEVYEMKPYERILYSYKQKQKATSCFKDKDYKNALTHYTKAVNALRYIEYDNTCDNDLRCDLIELMITCSNNAATCSMKMGEDGDCHYNANKFAMNALVLLDALYTKRGMKIHTALLNKGIADYKLFGEWKCKSLLFCVRYCMHKSEYHDAIEKLKQAKGIIDSYRDDVAAMKVLGNLEKEINKFMAVCLKKKKEVLKKEKARAQAMFGGKKASNKVTATTVADEKKENIITINKEEENTKQSSTTIPTSPSTIQTKKMNGILHKRDNDSSPRKSLKSVSFENESNKNDDDYEEEPWYSEHKEALILTGLSVLSIAGIMFLRGKK